MISTTEPEETDPHCSKARPGHGDGAGGAGGGAQETPGQRVGTLEGSCVRCASGLLCAYCCHTVCQTYSVYCCHTVSGLLCVYDVYTTYSCLLCAYCWHTVCQAYYVYCAYAHRRLHTQTAWAPNPHTVDQEEKVLKAQGAPGS